MQRIFIATSNGGKLRDFAGAASVHGIQVEGVPGFDSLPPVLEDGDTFEANARKKAEHYSRLVPGGIVLADDSGLEVEALGGAPGVHSARYASAERAGVGAVAGSHGNSDDAANNARLLRELGAAREEQRRARFVCVIAAAQDGRTLQTFCGAAQGRILPQPRGSRGFGYDPLFFFPALARTFGELTAEEKAAVSHRGEAFRRFLEWYERDPSPSPGSGAG
jgi:XTP/dITP diphosphohydrolase